MALAVKMQRICFKEKKRGGGASITWKYSTLSFNKYFDYTIKHIEVNCLKIKAHTFQTN